LKTTAILALAGLALCAGAPARADDAPHRCKYALVTRLPIRHVGPGLVPAIEGTINGTPATMLVDTGADSAYLTMTAALRRNLTLQISRERLVGVGGFSRLYTTRLEALSVGPGSVRRPEMNVIYNTGFSPAFDGILGAAFLLDMDMEIDLRAKQLRFFQEHDCEKAMLNIWKLDNTVNLPFAFTRDRSANPHFTVLVNGKEVDAEIDTGAGTTFLTLDAARRIGIDVNGKDAKSVPAAAGIGGYRAARWNVGVASVQIGGEAINGTAIDVLDMQGRSPAELFLGQDFLLAHRVLFAMGQNKIYVAYLGGDAFVPAARRADWVRQEAEGGNPDAQYNLAVMLGSGDAGRAWLDTAAAQGQPNAILEQGRRLLASGQAGLAVPQLRAGLDRLPADRYAPLWLALARKRAGQADLARTELAAAIRKQNVEDWPAPVAGFFLGEIDAARLQGAAQDPQQRCEAQGFIAAWTGAPSAQAADASRQCAYDTASAP
jgi:predicted aspartyl protease